MSTEWKPARFEGRWHVWRKVTNGSERSTESFRNRSTALVVAETLNGEQRQAEERIRQQIGRLWPIGKVKDDDL